MTIQPPIHLKALQKKQILEISFDEGGAVYSLPCAYLRANSPSAEMKHSPAIGADYPADLNIIGIDPVGNYGVKLIFSDGHQTGIYSWETLHRLAMAFKA